MEYRLSLLALTFVGVFAAETNSGCSNRFIVKAGYSKLNNDNLYFNALLGEYTWMHLYTSIDKVKTFSGHRVFGIGYAYKHYLPKDFFIGFNAGYENSDNKLKNILTNDENNRSATINFKLKHSINIMPFVGITIKNFDIYAMIGLEYTQINYSQNLKPLLSLLKMIGRFYVVYILNRNFFCYTKLQLN